MRVPEGGAGMQAHLAGIDRGEEIAADEQRARHSDAATKSPNPASTGAR